MRKFIGIFALVLLIMLLSPSLVLAQGADTGDPPPVQEAFFGEVVGVDPATGEFILLTPGGEEIPVMMAGAGADMQIGQELGAIGTMIDGVLQPTFPIGIRPEEPTFTHMTGIVTGDDFTFGGPDGAVSGEAGAGEGVIIGGWNDMAPEGEIITGLFQKDPGSGGFIPKQVKPFTERWY